MSCVPSAIRDFLKMQPPIIFQANNERLKHTAEENMSPLDSDTDHYSVTCLFNLSGIKKSLHCAKEKETAVKSWGVGERRIFISTKEMSPVFLLCSVLWLYSIVP